MLCGAMFYLMLFSKLVLKILGIFLDSIELFFSKILNFIKKKLNDINFKKKNT